MAHSIWPSLPTHRIVNSTLRHILVKSALGLCVMKLVLSWWVLMDKSLLWSLNEAGEVYHDHCWNMFCWLTLTKTYLAHQTIIMGLFTTFWVWFQLTKSYPVHDRKHRTLYYVIVRVSLQIRTPRDPFFLITSWSKYDYQEWRTSPLQIPSFIGNVYQCVSIYIQYGYLDSEWKIWIRDAKKPQWPVPRLSQDIVHSIKVKDNNGCTKRRKCSNQEKHFRSRSWLCSRWCLWYW